MPETKTIEGWLVVDWRKGSHKTRKSKPTQSELGSNELLAALEIEVEIPDVDVPTLSLEIDVPEPQVFSATMEALSDEDLPDWTDAANDVIEQHESQLRAAAGSPDDLGDLVDTMTTRTLLEVNTRPKPECVREYVQETVRRVHTEGEDDG